jgi:hypothetical protein
LRVIQPFELLSKKAIPRSEANIRRGMSVSSVLIPLFSFVQVLFRRNTPTRFDTRRKNVADGQGLARSASRWLTLVRDKAETPKGDLRRAGGASSRFGLIAVRTWPSAMRTAPRRKRSTGWMARPTQTHLDTVNRPFGVRLRVCLRQSPGFESKVSRGRNRRESITTVLRRSSAEEKTCRKELGD